MGNIHSSVVFQFSEWDYTVKRVIVFVFLWMKTTWSRTENNRINHDMWLQRALLRRKQLHSVALTISMLKLLHVAPFVVLADCVQSWGQQEREGESLNPGLPRWPWVNQPAMDDSSSLGKVSSSTESVATVTSEEFVLVQPSAAGSPQGSEGKPRLKVSITPGHTFTPDLNGASCTFHFPRSTKVSKTKPKYLTGQLREFYLEVFMWFCCGLQPRKACWQHVIHKLLAKEWGSPCLSSSILMFPFPHHV